MDNPLISVIVPVYNVEKYLDRCVESIVNQTYTNLEIILVDDGSPDNCPAMCDAWAEKDNRIKVIHKENGGVSSARNTGINAASGDYIAFVDSDDYIDCLMYEKMMNTIQINNSDVVICCINVYGNDWHYPNLYCETSEEIMIAFYRYQLYSPINKLISARIIKQKNIRFDESLRIAEDLKFNYYLFSEASKVQIISDCLYYYVENNESAIKDVDENVVLRWKVLGKILAENCVESTVGKYAYFSFANTIMCCFREMIAANSNKLVKEAYPEIVTGIRTNYKSIKKAVGITRNDRAFLTLIKYFPNSFLKMYKCYYYFRFNIKEE